MNITSKAVFFNDETIADGIVMFTGTGTTYTEEGVTLITPVIGLEADSLVYHSVDAQGNYVINVKNSSGEFLIELAEVENQEDWTNDRAGALKAVQQIERWKKKSSVGTELPDPATAEAGQVLGVVDDEYAFVNPPAPTNPKVYRALLSQSGENAPTAEVLENTIGDISFSYIAPGVYTAVSDDLYTLAKTFVSGNLFPNNAGSEIACSLGYVSPKNINIYILQEDGSCIDGAMFNIEILVYD